MQRMEMRRVELNGRKSEVQGRQVGRTETRSMKSTKKLEGGRGRQEESGRRKRERGSQSQKGKVKAHGRWWRPGKFQ